MQLIFPGPQIGTPLVPETRFIIFRSQTTMRILTGHEKVDATAAILRVIRQTLQLTIHLRVILVVA